jgi:hypothetical protein
LARVRDLDGITRERVPGRRWSRVRALLAVALLALAAAGVWLLRATRAAPARSAPIVAPTAAAPPAAAPVAGAPQRDAARASAPPEVTPEQWTQMAANHRKLYVNQLDSHGDHTGIFAFNPPGTKPIKGGLLVPEGYQLPPGYLRHYQTTDDGEQVGPILMFHPDYHPVGADGKPIELPADGVVPPELAPPDMPLQALEPPPVRRDWDETQEKVR